MASSWASGLFCLLELRPKWAIYVSRGVWKLRLLLPVPKVSITMVLPELFAKLF